jgi:hypothetical protein
MNYLTEIARQASAKMRRLLSNDPLLRPLGRVPDSTIHRALTLRRFGRADLFTPGKTLAPHRRRIAAMLAAFHFSPKQITEHHWKELKHADHLCAHCSDKKRCDRWLRGERSDEAPRRFCPNVMTFERWRRDYLQRDSNEVGAEGDSTLEPDLAKTREFLSRRRPL